MIERIHAHISIAYVHFTCTSHIIVCRLDKEKKAINRVIAINIHSFFFNSLSFAHIFTHALHGSAINASFGECLCSFVFVLVSSHTLSIPIFTISMRKHTHTHTLFDFYSISIGIAHTIKIASCCCFGHWIFTPFVLLVYCCYCCFAISKLKISFAISNSMQYERLYTRKHTHTKGDEKWIQRPFIVNG